MVNVSKRPLNQKLESRLYSQLSNLIAKANKKTSAFVIEDLLTDAERIMLAKRFATILMLSESCPKQTIAELLKMSRTTVVKIEKDYKRGEYTSVLRVVHTHAKSEKDEVFRTIEVILRLGMPPRGKDRWKWLDKHLGQNYPKRRHSTKRK